MALRQGKYVLLGFITVIAIILTINSGITDNFKTHYNEKERILVFESNTKRVESLLRDELAEILKKERWQREPKTNCKNATDEDTATLEMLIDSVQSCLNAYEPKEEKMKSDDLFEILKSTVDRTRKSYFYTLSLFSEMMSSLNIQVAIIEPSIIFCMLKPQYRKLLLKRSFNVTNFTGADNIITFGILGDDVIELEKKENILMLRNIGFQPYFIQETPAAWMTENGTEPMLEKYTSHVFYGYYGWTIHVVVFWKRNNYFWHSGLNSEEEMNIPKKQDLVFADYDSAYENFTFVSLYDHSSGFNFYIPSSPDYFLFQMLSSRFLECDLTRSTSVKNDTDSEKDHGSLSVSEFNDRFLIGLQELRKIFKPLLMNFWIFSGTMLGWYRQCDVIPYTSDVDFGAWVSEVEDLDNIILYFQKNKKLYILERMGVLEEALEFQLRADGLRVDVFFLYQINNGSWASGHRPSLGYYFRYHYPPFTLCSAELLHQKVQVPCETERVIITEYGPNWRNPVSSWNYESSIHNRGPDIYWDKERLPKAFQEY